MAESNRSCGGCTACCEGWLADDSMNLKLGSACSHCSEGGCSIYETRPERPCRAFRCAWLEHPELFPEELRPDKSGAIAMLDRNWHRFRTVRIAPVGEEVPQQTFQWFLAYAKERNLPLIFRRHKMEKGEWVESYLNAVGPTEFTDAVKVLPAEHDVFWRLES